MFARMHFDGEVDRIAASYRGIRILADPLTSMGDVDLPRAERSADHPSGMKALRRVPEPALCSRPIKADTRCLHVLFCYTCLNEDTWRSI